MKYLENNKSSIKLYGKGRLRIVTVAKVPHILVVYMMFYFYIQKIVNIFGMFNMLHTAKNICALTTKKLKRRQGEDMNLLT